MMDKYLGLGAFFLELSFTRTRNRDVKVDASCLKSFDLFSLKKSIGDATPL